MTTENEQIKVLFIGDIVGRPGRNAVKHFLDDLRASENNDYDFIIANVENASHGFGLTEKNHNDLASYGIDCFTSGNHIWDKKDIYSYIDKSDRLIRPMNYPKGTYGVGYRIFDVKNTKVAVMNLLGRTFMTPVDSPWEILENEIEKIKEQAPVVIVDFHAEATSEKRALGFYLDGRISALFGTHTHVQTSDNQILPNGTGYITDLGMTGPLQSVLGVEPECTIRKFRTGLPVRFTNPKGECTCEGCFFEIDNKTGKTIYTEGFRR